MSSTDNLPYKLLIFDWDGTLMDSEARIVNCLRLASEARGFAPRSDEELKNVIGLGLREALKQLFPEEEDHHIEDMADIYRHQYLHENETPSELFPGVTELLEDLESKGH